MDDNIQVCVVYIDGSIRIYGQIPKVGLRPFIRTMKFSNYGKALQFAHEFEAKQHK